MCPEPFGVLHCVSNSRVFPRRARLNPTLRYRYLFIGRVEAATAMLTTQIARRALQQTKVSRLLKNKDFKSSGASLGNRHFSVNTPTASTTMSSDASKKDSSANQVSAERKMSALELQHLRRKGERISMLTAYDYPSAKHAERCPHRAP